MDCSPPGSSVHGILQARILPCPPPGDLPDPGNEPISPAYETGLGEMGDVWEENAGSEAKSETSELTPTLSSSQSQSNLSPNAVHVSS